LLAAGGNRILVPVAIDSFAAAISGYRYRLNLQQPPLIEYARDDHC
jgi:hypothetical protein